MAITLAAVVGHFYGSAKHALVAGKQNPFPGVDWTGPGQCDQCPE